MRGVLLAGLLALTGSSLPAPITVIKDENPAIAPGMRQLPVHVGGRVATRPIPRSPVPALEHEHQWPSVYFEAAFRGTSVALRFDDAVNEYRLLIDDLVPIAIVQPSRSTYRIATLEIGAHRLRLEKISESASDRGSFQGFYIDGRSKPLPVIARSRKMEFIGDSSMTGYGARSAKLACTSDEVRLTTDTQNAYAALVAKHYNADYQINAVSARGVVRNYAGILPDATLPLLYPYMFLDKTAVYDGSNWRPDIIFIKLNADFVGDLKPGERWPTFSDVARDYAEGFGDFVSLLHRRSPSADFLIWWFDPEDLGTPKTRAAFDQVQRIISAQARQAGVAKLDFLPMRNAGLDRSACDAHYSLGDHRILARRIIEAIDADRPSWRGK